MSGDPIKLNTMLAAICLGVPVRKNNPLPVTATTDNTSVFLSTTPIPHLLERIERSSHTATRPNPKLYTQIGHAYIEADDLQKAAWAFTTSLELNEHPEPWVGMMRVHRENKNLAAAMESFQKATALDAHYARAYCEWGITLLSLRQQFSNGSEKAEISTAAHHFLRHGIQIERSQEFFRPVYRLWEIYSLKVLKRKVEAFESIDKVIEDIGKEREFKFPECRLFRVYLCLDNSDTNPKPDWRVLYRIKNNLVPSLNPYAINKPSKKQPNEVLIEILKALKGKKGFTPLKLNK